MECAKTRKVDTDWTTGKPLVWYRKCSLQNSCGCCEMYEHVRTIRELLAAAWSKIKWDWRW